MKFSVPCLLIALAAVAVVVEETTVEALRTIPTTTTHTIGAAPVLAVPRGGDASSSYAAKLEAVKDAVLSSTVSSVSLVVY